MNPRHPVYIVSKSRADNQMTSTHLSRMGVPHYVVVEQSQVVDYLAHRTALASVVVLDPQYQRDYEVCDDLGLTKSVGPGAARNFAWDHAIASGAEYHWVMDDNIMGFFRLNYNLKTPVSDGTIFRAMEAFVERYDNVAMAGPNYFMFAPRKAKLAPFVINTRIYSCNLIRNDVPYRWRGRYNEDTDLSLRMLKDGWCTVQFYAFLQNKATTQHVKGGNTEAFYSKEGTKPKSEMLYRLHPDVTKLVWRFKRDHHFVDYTGFRQQLRRRVGVYVKPGIDDFGMVLEKLDKEGGEWRRIRTPWDDGAQPEAIERIDPKARYSVIPDGPPGSGRPSQPPAR